MIQEAIKEFADMVAARVVEQLGRNECKGACITAPPKKTPIDKIESALKAEVELKKIIEETSQKEQQEAAITLKQMQIAAAQVAKVVGNAVVKDEIGKLSNNSKLTGVDSQDYSKLLERLDDLHEAAKSCKD